ncbi:MAG: response regulator transcription factor [Anaerolineae bacterium]|nr:response regulator transcription factor [Anaerolineae bacterium]
MLRRTLAYAGFHVLTAADGRDALVQIDAHRPDVIVLDWMMPELDGMGVMEELRAMNNRAMVLMLTARDAIEDRVEGLQGGADDYLVKPFAPAELLARVHALLRRSGSHGPDAGESKPLAHADLSLNPVTRETRRGDVGFELTPTEFDLLQYLMRHPRQVLHRHQILQEVWGYDFGGDDNVLEVYIGYLRRKMEQNGQSRLIQTVRGVGYVLREE